MNRIRPEIDAMIATASDWFGIQPYYIRYTCKRPKVLEARDMVIWNARKSGYSLTEIGAALNKHHTTILSRCQKMGITQ